MDKSEVRAVVQRALTPMRNALGLERWKIEVSYGPCSNPNWGASCDRRVDYGEADIVINPEHMHDEAQILKTLRHELLHVALAPFDLVYDTAGDGGQEIENIRHRVWTFAVENAVAGLELVFDHLGKEEQKLLNLRAKAK